MIWQKASIIWQTLVGPRSILHVLYFVWQGTHPEAHNHDLLDDIHIHFLNLSSGGSGGRLT